MTSAIEVLRLQNAARLASARRSLSRMSFKTTIVRKTTGLTTAAVFGTMSRMKIPNTLAGFPWKLGIIGAAQLTEGLASGMLQAAAAGMADAATAIYVERTIATDSLIAGGEI